MIVMDKLMKIVQLHYVYMSVTIDLDRWILATLDVRLLVVIRVFRMVEVVVQKIVMEHQMIDEPVRQYVQRRHGHQTQILFVLENHLLKHPTVELQEHQFEQKLVLVLRLSHARVSPLKCVNE